MKLVQNFKKAINILRFLLSTHSNIGFILFIIGVELVYVFVGRILENVRDEFLSKKTERWFVYFIMPLACNEAMLILIELIVELFIHSIRNSVYREIIKCIIYSDKNENIHHFRVQSNATLEFIRNRFKIGILMGQYVSIFRLIRHKWIFGALLGVYWCISVLFVLCRVHFRKKKVEANASQVQHLQEALRLRNILTIHNSREFISKKYLDLPEYDHQLILVTEFHTLFNRLMIYSAEILRAFRRMNIDQNTATIDTICDNVGFFICCGILGTVVSDAVSDFRLIPTEFNSKSRLSNQVKSAKIDVDEQYNNEVAVLSTETLLNDKSIAYNLNNNGNVSCKKQFRKQLATHGFSGLFCEILGLKSIDEIYRMKPERLSYGQRKTVAIFRTLLTKAKVYILHRPFTGIDPKYHLRLTNVFDNYNSVITE
ncbi:hypothetical protein ECANGB1_236 [Enterospora canceri]|uniref:ABC transporter domain-containing protein n=1 Tax=Enterospora canceri TaxID=1081671 RepID=A0A1Y1S887_9MICR|nr:hypothetical protein ECANGB1_236 [Enterospora canceri]